MSVVVVTEKCFIDDSKMHGLHTGYTIILLSF